MGLSIDHGKVGKFAIQGRLRQAGYTNITSWVGFSDSQGRTFRADFVAQILNGVWIAVGSKKNTAGLSENQHYGYLELEAVGGRIATSKPE